MAFSPVRTGRSEIDRNLDRISAALQPQPIQWILVGQQGGPAFQSSWVNFDPNGAPNGRDARFTLDSLGWVVLDGLVTGGTPGSTSIIFTLPAGFRPLRRLKFAVVSNELFGEVVIRDTGAVNALVGSGVNLSLAGIRFVAEQ